MIHPASSDIPDGGRTKSSTARDSIFCFRRWFLRLSRLWTSVHMSYRGGKYSIERLIALEEYTRQHSLLHVVFVCVASFLPAEAFIIAQEVVPLQDPTLGWKANFGFWVRAALVIGAVLHTVIVQAKYFLKGFVISRYQQISLLTIVVVVQMIVAVVFAANVCFPIPFTVITLVPAFYVVSVVSMCVVLGVSVIREVLKHRDHLIRFGAFIAAQQFMALIYPAYQVLFHVANNSSYEMPVILLLPVIKLVVKNITLHCVTHLEDMMPQAVIFTVDFFNALYISTSMESATSPSTVVIIVLIDIVQSAIVIFRLHRRTATVLSRLNGARKTSGGDDNLLRAACQLCWCTDEFKRQNRQRIRIRSCLLHNISLESREFLDRLERIPSRASSRYPARDEQVNPPEINPLEKCQKINNRREQATVSPAPALTFARELNRRTVIPKRHGRIVTSHTGVLREALEVLFTVECLLLSAFLDAFVPLFYGIFIFVMVHFQSAEYHSELAGITKDTIGNVVDSIFIFAIVELVAFGFLAGLIYRNLRINSLHHLAFVLETQTELIQSKLLAWITMTLAFRVVHFGVDFTFQFSWLANSSK